MNPYEPPAGDETAADEISPPRTPHRPRSPRMRSINWKASRPLTLSERVRIVAFTLPAFSFLSYASWLNVKVILNGPQADWVYWGGCIVGQIAAAAIWFYCFSAIVRNDAETRSGRAGEFDQSVDLVVVAWAYIVGGIAGVFLILSLGTDHVPLIIVLLAVGLFGGWFLSIRHISLLKESRSQIDKRTA